MANEYLATVLPEARAFVSEIVNKKFEQRAPLTNILQAFMSGQQYIPDIASIKKADRQATSLDYLTRKNFTIKNGKTCVLGGETAGSGRSSLTWQSIGVEILHSEKQYQNNEVAGMRALANSLYEAEKSLLFGSGGLDSILLAYLEANRTYINNGTINTWRGVPDFYMESSVADKDDFYNNLVAEMAENNYSPNFFDIANTSWMATMNKLKAQGTGNAVNTSYQFDGVDFLASNLITVPATMQSVHYVIPEGGVAIVDWNDPLNRQGKTSGGKTWGTYQSKLMPSLTYDLFITENCDDTTADGGNVQDLVTKFEITLNFAVTSQPLSTPTETTIAKYQILK